MHPLLESNDPVSQLNQVTRQNLPRIQIVEVQLCAAGRARKSGAAGVTYLRSKAARMEESDFSATAYDRVYAAERSEIFQVTGGESCSDWPASRYSA
jgi:2-dehydro-3-deoxy-D-arabinonate dehydratase